MSDLQHIGVLTSQGELFVILFVHTTGIFICHILKTQKERFMKLTQLVITGCLLSGLAIASCRKSENKTLNDADKDFLLKTSVGNTAEIDAATLATEKATNVAVRNFAQHMLMEHGMAQTDLKNVAASVGFPVKDSLDPAHIAIKAQLASLNGRRFDSAYMYVQVTDHQTTVANFNAELSNGQHKDVKNYASTYLPHIQMHLQSADSIAKAYFPR